MYEIGSAGIESLPLNLQLVFLRYTIHVYVIIIFLFSSLIRLMAFFFHGVVYNLTLYLVHTNIS